MMRKQRKTKNRMLTWHQIRDWIKMNSVEKFTRTYEIQVEGVDTRVRQLSKSGERRCSTHMCGARKGIT